MKLKKRLNEGLNNIKSKYPNISDKDFYTIISADPTYDGDDELGRYGEWLLGAFRNQEFSQERLDELVGKIESIEQDLNVLVDDEFRDIRVYQDKEWTVYRPKDAEQLLTLGSGCDWQDLGLSIGEDGYGDEVTRDDVVKRFEDLTEVKRGYIFVVTRDDEDKYVFYTPNPKKSADEPFCIKQNGHQLDAVHFLYQSNDSKFKRCLVSPIVSVYLEDLKEGNDGFEFTLGCDKFMNAVEHSNCKDPDGRWWADFLEDDYGAFDWYDDSGVSFNDVLNWCDDYISEDDFNRMKELGCKASSLKEFLHSDDPIEMFPYDVQDDISCAFRWAYDFGSKMGAINDCWSDFKSEIKELFTPLNARYYVGDGLHLSGDKKAWSNFVSYTLVEVAGENGDTYFQNDLEDLIKQEIVCFFDCKQPYYGWEGFDYDAFSEELDYRLGDIDYEPDEEEEEPELDDEDNEMIGKQFKFIYDKDRLDDRFKEYDGEIVEILRSSGEDNGWDEPLWEIKIVDTGEVLIDIPSDCLKPLNESLEESLNEDIEKHDTLNPLLWNEDGTLKEEVRDKLMQIVDEFIKGLEEDGITMDVDDVKIVGSNCSYNYTKDSDLDLHIVAKNIQAPEELYALLYSAYRSIWNKNYDIDFYGIPVEIFVETPELVGDEVTTIDVEV